MKKLLLSTTAILMGCLLLNAQDTTVVQTFDYESTTRSAVFQFPTTPHNDYEKIIMQYSMRCKDGLISTGADRNRGCGEWDYSCNTYITDSSRIDSLKATHPSHIISNFGGTVFDFTRTPTYTFHQFKQKEVTYTSTISEVTATVGTGLNNQNHPFTTTLPISKSQYLILASEVTGLTTNMISGLRLDVSTIGSNVDYLRIKMKNTNQTNLDSTNIEAGLSEVYFLNTPIAGTGIQDFNFYNNFNWDGTSNILIEFSYKNNGTGTNTEVVGNTTTFNSALHNNAGTDNYITFNGSGIVEVPTDAMSANISNEITVSFWAHGDSLILPRNTSIFGAADANNQRQLNVHLPWNNSRIYWDCGNDGTGYDRIEKDAGTPEIGGRWNHWAFTKNATNGEMRIYLNGNLWHSGTGKTRPIDIQEFEIGGNVTGNHRYYGKLDEFSVWNTELNQTEIQTIMYNDIRSTHPKYANLMAYYQFNEGSGTSTVDASTYGHIADLHASPAWGSLRGKDLFRNFSVYQDRPNITLVEGVYTSTITSTTLLDSVANAPNEIKSYRLIGNDLIEAVDTVLEYMAGYSYIIDDSSGMVVDSVLYPTDSTINVLTYNYFTKSPTKFEIMSFVTPYGIGIDFGMEGKTWSFDVTDFGPILKGPKRMSLERGGQWQEEMDIKFLFIKGTPSRDVLDINQIWPVRSQSYTRILDNSRMEARNIDLLSNAKQFKVRTAVTGHGQQGEFIPRTHFININGGSNELQWQAWTECADNPIYPQGGTWIYDRAGWCPGAPTDVQDLDVTALATPGSPLTVDYGIFTASGASNYIVNSQLVSYGDANFTLDAAISDIISPSLTTAYGRFNPICGNPVIKIKNNGSTVLTDLDITYGAEGEVLSTFKWSGSLEFLEEEEVTLPLFAWGSSGKNTFVATVSNPNNSADAYEQNNELKSSYDLVPRYDQDFVIVMRTNNAANETSWTLTDMNDNVIASRVGGLAVRSIYRDTIRGMNQCLKLQINDSDDDGISFWANNDGNGYVRMKNLGQQEISLATDFGKVINYQFIAGFPVGIEESSSIQTVNIYPNPGTGLYTLEMDGYEDQIEIQVVNQLGQRQFGRMLRPNSGFLKTTIDLSSEANGVYFLRIIENGKRVQVKKLIKN